MVIEEVEMKYEKLEIENEKVGHGRMEDKYGGNLWKPPKKDHEMINYVLFMG